MAKGLSYQGRQSMWKFDWLDIAHLRAELHHFVKLMEVGHCLHKPALYY